MGREVIKVQEKEKKMRTKEGGREEEEKPGTDEKNK